ncbi:hypothetical protein FHL15_011315 [Xylaria flabelliformis]|uniref:AAA+ ATPase domain-containing protein n=1 Tax=Xylaria flabelliformis TaxID=2512241 RepID=A0A553HIK8_9PEZI|nr:hypothetical protein FHL15_011315 [Xylaria flabelliformis]
MELEQEGKSSGSAPTNNEGADIEDLRSRFAEMESKIAAVSDIFGLQELGEAAEDEDSESCSEDSDDDFVLNRQRRFFLDAVYFMRNARQSYRRLRSVKRNRRNARKMTETDAEDGVDKVKHESVRQISTTAFLKSEPAVVTWMNWDRFLRPKEDFVKSVMAPIDAVIGEPEHFILKLASHATQSPDSAVGGSRNITEDWEQALLPERIKVSSVALPQFLYYEEQLREHLDELDKYFENWDGTGKPTKGRGDTVVKDPSTDSSNLDSTKEEKVKELGREKRSSEPKERNPEVEADANYEGENTIDSITALVHLRCLMKFIDTEVKPKIRYIESDQCRRILFHDLWHLFKPGNEVIDQTEKQAYRIVRVQIPQHRIEDPWQRWYNKSLGDENQEDGTPVTIYCAYIDFDGTHFGPVSVKFSIPPFGELKDIKSLPIYPLRLAKKANLRDSLVARGKMLINIAKFKPMYYMGLTLDKRDEVDSQVVVDFGEALADEKRKDWAPTIEPLRTEADERIDYLCRAACCDDQVVNDDDFIDSELTDEFVKSLIPDTSFRAPSLLLSPRPLEEALPGTDNEPTDDEFVVMTYRVFGFVLRTRKWAQLDLTFLRYENSYARNSALGAFDRLELPDGHREMVKSLVTQHFRDRQSAFARDGQTDLVRGKGKGLILLLHGAPGVGKTTTAGDLGTTAREVEQELEKNFALASRWGCILLLDEADVFLSARERKDFERNGLVSVFLRVLEYYTGILFLTTNRIGDFDEAFASRIHMSLHYPELDEAKTKKVFKLNLDLIQERFDKRGRRIIFDASSIEDFATKHFNEHPYSRWNGRQIRNACQTALALAEFDAQGGKIQGEMDNKIEVKLQLKHFQLVQTAYLDFGCYLGDIRGTQGDRRAIDYGFRAKSDTPYQTTPSRFSSAMRDSHRSSSLSAEYNQSSDPFQSFTNQGAVSGPGSGYGVARSSNMEYQTYGQYGPQQGRMGQGGGYDRYENPQGHGYMHPGNQQGQMDPRRYQQFNPQGQGPQGQYYQGQPQYNVQHGGIGGGGGGGDVQNPTMPGDFVAQNRNSRGPGSGGLEGGGSA